MTRTPEDLTTERGSTHGDYPTMSKAVMDIMRVFEGTLNWDSLPETVQVFLFNNAQKCARILTGNPYEPDHYDDIAGYAHLARKSIAPDDQALDNSLVVSGTTTLEQTGRSPIQSAGLVVAGHIKADQIATGSPTAQTVFGSGGVGGSGAFTVSGPVVVYPDGRTAPLSSITGTASYDPQRDPQTAAGTPSTTLGSAEAPATTQGAPTEPGTAPGAPAETASTSQEGDAGLTTLGSGPDTFAGPARGRRS